MSAACHKRAADSEECTSTALRILCKEDRLLSPDDQILCLVMPLLLSPKMSMNVLLAGIVMLCLFSSPALAFGAGEIPYGQPLDVIHTLVDLILYIF